VTSCEQSPPTRRGMRDGVRTQTVPRRRSVARRLRCQPVGGLVVIGNLKENDIIAACKKLGSIDLMSGEELRIDLTKCSFIRPAGTVFLATLMRVAHAEGYGVSVVAQRGSDVSKYLDRMRFTDIAKFCGADVSSFDCVSKHSADSRFVELSTFDAKGDEAGLDEITDTLKARSTTWVTEHGRKRMRSAVAELGINVEEHSGSAGIIAAQHYGGQERCVEFAVGDGGRGIRQTLKEGGLEYETGTAALRAATETFATSTGEAGRGKGLHWIREYACTEGVGAFTIVSGDAAVTYRHNSAPRAIDFDLWVPGTFVFGKFATQ
jgi:hypothetical protein